MAEFADRLQQALGSAFTIERELPLSGLGRLYLATETATGRRVSVQALPPDIAGRLDVNRFRAGMDRVARLRHPGISPIVAFGAQGDLVWCVWPHPRGESLRYRLVRDGGLSTADAMQVLHDIADALAYGHAEGVSHGDLKVDNIHIEDGRAVVAEYGMRSALNQALGSASGGGDARADVHALAIAGQQMLGGRAGDVSQTVARALSIDPAEQFAGAAAFRDALGTPPSTVRRRSRAKVVVLAALLAVVGVLGWKLLSGRTVLDPDLIAVAPFDVLDPEQAVWREGLMTLMSANLEGAGPLRAVSPTLIVRNWQGQVDAQSAAQLGRRTGARLALYGRLVPIGGDSIRLQASLIDASLGGTVGEMNLADDKSRLDRLGDSLTVQVLRQLSLSRPIGASRRGTLGASSLPALKAFLEGEQSFRRSDWDSAVAHYQRAIDLDSTFALALFRAGIVMGWQRSSEDSLSTAYLRRAGDNNHGLSPRDSLLVLSESLYAAVAEGPENPRYWELYRRMYATVQELTRRFPRDPEAWYEAGEIYYHSPMFAQVAEMRSAFDHAIALDSAFAPAYIHQVGLALEMGDRAGALRYLDRYIALDSKDIYADGMRLTRRLIDPAQARSPATQQFLDTASADLIEAAWQSFPGWGDSLESAVRLMRARNTAHPTAAGRERPNEDVPTLRVALFYHGRIREALALPGTDQPILLAAGLWMGIANGDSMRPILERSLRSTMLVHAPDVVLAAPWLARQRDSTTLREIARRGETIARSSSHPNDRIFGRFAADGANALLALVRGDTLAAIRGLQALPDTACTRCTLYVIQLAELLDARRMDEEAARLLTRDSPGFDHPTDGFWALYRARLAERRGDRNGATPHWSFVRDVWRNADPELRGYVREAEAALARDDR